MKNRHAMIFICAAHDLCKSASENLPNAQTKCQKTGVNVIPNTADRSF